MDANITEMMDEPCFAVFSTFFKVSLFYSNFLGAKSVEIRVEHDVI